MPHEAGRDRLVMPGFVQEPGDLAAEKQGIDGGGGGPAVEAAEVMARSLALMLFSLPS
jgi:hypothetical protein